MPSIFADLEKLQQEANVRQHKQPSDDERQAGLAQSGENCNTLESNQGVGAASPENSESGVENSEAGHRLNQVEIARSVVASEIRSLGERIFPMLKSLQERMDQLEAKTSVQMKNFESRLTGLQNSLGEIRDLCHEFDQQTGKRADDPQDWTSDDVDDWLASIGMSQPVRQRFLDLEIDGELLVMLQRRDLTKDFGILEVADKKSVDTLSNALDTLRSSYGINLEMSMSGSEAGSPAAAASAARNRPSPTQSIERAVELDRTKKRLHEIGMSF